MTSQRLSLAATVRTLTGKKVKDLRAQGFVPAHVFGKDVTGAILTLPEREFSKVYKEAGETGLVDLKIEGEATPRPVLVVQVDRHPLSDAILHIDFHQVNLKEKVTANIPVETVGESEAVKEGGVLVMAYNELEVEALPTELPEKFELDLSKLAKVGDSLTVADLAYDREKVQVSVDQDEVLVTIQAPKEEVVEEVVAEPAEVEITKGGPTTEEGKAEAAASTPTTSPEPAKAKKE
jgi:large subunit ribosomal protein L25